MAQSEQTWLTTWVEPIRRSTLTKKRSWVTIEGWMEVTVGVTSLELRDQSRLGAPLWMTGLGHMVLETG
jgi:hypothetical protein